MTAAPSPTISESADTLDGQIRWLIDGKRLIVLLPPGTPAPLIPEGLDACWTSLGIAIYDPEHITPLDITERIAEGRIGDLLGYGVNGKPPGATDCVVVRGPDGREKQAVVVNAETKEAAMRAAFHTADWNDSVTVEPAARILKERTDELARHELTLHPYDAAVDAAALERLRQANPESRVPHKPTWIIRRQRRTVPSSGFRVPGSDNPQSAISNPQSEVVGAVGMNSLPLFHLYLPVNDVTCGQCHDVLKFIENTYRTVGVREVATIIETDCASYPLAARHGYMEQTEERVFFKLL